MTKNRDLIPLHQLVKDPDSAFKNDQLKALLNRPAPPAWVKRNPFAQNAEYLPIDKVELMLDAIFQEWRVEVKEVAQMFNGIRVTVRVHYKLPTSGEWTFHDGVGSKELQTKRESGTLKPDFSNMNAGAIEIALPIAKTRAIKDACDHIGKLFGRDLNRKDTIEFSPKYLEVDISQEMLEKGRAK